MTFSYKENHYYTNGRKSESLPREKNIYGQVRDLFNFDDVDKMILGVGDCRTGTTAWLAACVRAGFPGYYQIGKGGMRCLLKNMEPPYDGKKIWTPDHVKFGERGRVVVAKETIGPQNVTECTFNPVKAYSYSDYDKKGLDPSQLHVVFFLRNPVATLKSWDAIFGSGVDPASGVQPLDPKTLVSNYVLAAKTEMEILGQLQEQNISHTVFAQELLQPPSGVDQAKHSAQVIQTIFNRAGTPISDEQAQFSVSDWREQGSEYLKQQIYFPTEPNYNYEGGIYPTLASAGYEYKSRDADLDELAPYDLSYFQSAGLIDSYNELLEVSAQHLGVEKFEHLYLQ